MFPFPHLNLGYCCYCHPFSTYTWGIHAVPASRTCSVTDNCSFFSQVPSVPAVMRNLCNISNYNCIITFLWDGLMTNTFDLTNYFSTKCIFHLYAQGRLRTFVRISAVKTYFISLVTEYLKMK